MKADIIVVVLQVGKGTPAEDVKELAEAEANKRSLRPVQGFRFMERKQSAFHANVEELFFAGKGVKP
ncbi:hypothetical protein SEA_REDFIELD_42 [Microbacterium phage Redfield]|uniref:Uncharacterized protein n=3 Tax=Ilzatvirus hamlet TaxID=2560591 RepID=A0A345MEL1_9CAUD|nr:hypothetical protein PBI_BEEBEE8_43 [Microbacterium phage BeeBee8]AXH46432.1 hypothetical protein SEA_REDFIELD_42 [Microbacterium phage Redfield]AXH68992.1 hypothetical protein SCHNAPSIDEE_42 [Microbacterium phage Schnapsidee]